jgi:regulator of RNase E activity RraA
MSLDTFDRNDARPWKLPVRGEPYERASQELIGSFADISAATACAKLHHMGITRTFIEGPRPLAPGARVVGSALTLQFLPQREDVASGMEQEYVERYTALWAVLDTVQPGDVLVIDARAAARTGCLGEMLIRNFVTRGGAGIVVDGRIRDTPKIGELNVPVWSTGATPHYASQSELFPWAYDVPVGVGGALVLPGDLIVADDDGAVVVPQARAAELAAKARDHEDWEVFSRSRIAEGGALSRYYPLDDEATAEYEQWRVDKN